MKNPGVWHRARYEGEEFFIILPESTDEHVQQIAEQLRCIVVQETKVTISCGYITSKPEMQLETMLQMADQALYRAKDEGRNKIAGY